MDEQEDKKERNMTHAHVIHHIQRPDASLVASIEKQSTATLHEAMGRRGAIDSEIKPLYSGMRLCGPAITVRCLVGDNLMLLKAIYVAKAGDVLVADIGDSSEIDGWGEIASLAAKVRGISGLVTNCSVRDGLAIKEMGFPVFARGLSIKGTVKETLGSINHPISFGGIIVHPGDIILGDDDGVVIVPREEASEVVKKAQERESKEAKAMGLIREGKCLLEIYEFDKILEQKGCIEE
jgi:4-hydroxy-4-methyl-2-oxoglutarate aldolase